MSPVGDLLNIVYCSCQRSTSNVQPVRHPYCLCPNTSRYRIILAFGLGFHTGQGLRDGYVRSVRLYCADLPLAEALMALTADVPVCTVTGTESLRQ